MAHIDLPKDVTAAMPQMLKRLALMVFGAALVISAFAVWLVPSAGGLPEMSMIKVALSAAVLIAGLGCMAYARETREQG